MSALTIYPVKQPEHKQTFTDYQIIQSQLTAIDVQFERWQADHPIPANAEQAEILKAYEKPVKDLMERFGFRSVDVVSLQPDHPDKAAFRQKFLDEHIHEDFEVRFFVAGSGLFYLHVGNQVYAVLCEQGDLISVPAGVTHWFDMGANPNFKCIRFFTTPEGWVAKFTASEIAKTFPTFDQYIAQLS